MISEGLFHNSDIPRQYTVSKVKCLSKWVFDQDIESTTFTAQIQVGHEIPQSSDMAQTQGRLQNPTAAGNEARARPAPKLPEGFKPAGAYGDDMMA